MFESNMVDNLQSINNPWRELVSPEFKVFLDSLSTSSKEDETETEED